MHPRTTLSLPRFAAPLLACLGAATGAHAQVFTIDWYSIDCGGGQSTGGPFTLHATIGQWDAGRLTSTSGLSLEGGFEPGMTFGAPCRADFNDDTRVNSQDFFDFLTAFFAQAPRADFNVDRVINSQDFFDFLAVFFAGCP